jgi:hypothetical protein
MTLLAGTLAVLHVIFGMNFLGAVFILNVVLGPVVLLLSPSTMVEFFTKFWSPMAKFLHATIGGTVLFGLLLYAAGGFSSLTGDSMIFLDSGILLGLLAVIEAEALQIPTVNRLVRQLSAGGPTQQDLTPEQKKIFGRVKVAGMIGVVTVTLSVILMVAAAWA